MTSILDIYLCSHTLLTCNQFNQYFWIEVVYNLGVLGHFSPWGILQLGNISTFWVQKLVRKIVKILKDLELHQVFMYNFVRQNILIFPI